MNFALAANRALETWRETAIICLLRYQVVLTSNFFPSPATKMIFSSEVFSSICFALFIKTSFELNKFYFKGSIILFIEAKD